MTRNTKKYLILTPKPTAKVKNFFASSDLLRYASGSLANSVSVKTPNRCEATVLPPVLKIKSYFAFKSFAFFRPL